MVLLLAAGIIAQRRLTLCESKPHPGAHHAPIPGASGDPANFGCKLLAPATLTEKAIDLAAFITVLAFFRSLLMNIHLWNARRPKSPMPKPPYRFGAPPRDPKG